MRPAMNDKGGYNQSLAQSHQSSNSCNSEFHKSNNTNKKILGSRSKPTPSKWDDAQKWLAGLSGAGDHSHSKNKPRNSNADDRRLLNSASQRARESTSSTDVGLHEDIVLTIGNVQDEGETKNIDSNEALWRMSKPESPVEVKSVCLRDVGTEMTPLASQEPSRTGTPIRATTPALTSPIDSTASSPGRGRNQSNEGYQLGVNHLERNTEVVVFNRGGDEVGRNVVSSNGAIVQVKTPSSLENRALAWDEAERAKYMARYKREEVKIQAWENHEKRKAEMEMKRMEVKAERMKSRAQEKLANKLAATRRIAEEKRANAEAKLNEQAARTAERADYIRRTGHLPFNFNISMKLPSLCG
ncbi:uncharacterized protein A4U43_C04F4840 [Asparagus officinalis]|uniref:Remorin C-terminal domain-containing protein n=1 Tax=Asparagus officinalis TaxID=4686 RepID=A0A5P1EYV4_ASPOF|nr:uncharacterized protein At3g61260-like [Asparagus officinalis]XP_020260199.1 uncharacterized protein At3g61260-like [Asparagus officinalis]ONK71112.1 uncharacterized protein A4U43_C04F4840 [Asparagus officinalis]